MMRRMAEGFRRICALAMALFIVLSQIAMPVPALAADLSALPTVNLYYPEGEGAAMVPVLPVLYGGMPVYWATVPDHALSAGLTLEIISPNPDVEYVSQMGLELYPSDASGVDGFPATYIDELIGGELQASYPLYISTSELPAEEEEPEARIFCTVSYASLTSFIFSSATSLPRCLPILASSPVRSKRSSTIWNATPRCFPYSRPLSICRSVARESMSPATTGAVIRHPVFLRWMALTASSPS